MYSQCPECLTRFRVTAAALRMAHGTVRCGRCGSAFDALPRLSDSLPEEGDAAAPMPPMLEPYSPSAAVETPVSPEDATDTGGEVTEFHFSADDIEQVFVDARDWHRRFGSNGQRAPRAANGEGPGEAPANPAPGAPVVFVHEPEAIEDITLEGERIVIEGLPALDDDLRAIVGEALPEDEPGRDDAVRLPDAEPPPRDLESTDEFEVLREAPEAVYPVLGTDGASSDAGGARAQEPATATTTTTTTTTKADATPIVPFRLRQRPEAIESTPVDEDIADGDDDDERTGRRATVAWGLGTVLLAATLGAQVAHHYRQDLSRDANVGPVVRSVYERLGRPLPPHRDLSAFELRQWGASEAAPSADGSVTVRASLRNAAAFAQPMPLLRLEFEDRFGGTVARRDFQPGEWLKDPAQASGLLAPGAKTEAELDVVDAGPDAVGYRLDVCMRDATGVTTCAQDGSVPQ